MTRPILFLAVICALVAVNMANTGQKFIGNAVNASYPGDCYYKDEDVPIKIGSTYLSKKTCESAKCREDFVLQFSLCPSYGYIAPECERIVDKNAPYPKCCPTFKCPNKP